jgi:predicted transcriptional regulator of viral defense system
MAGWDTRILRTFEALGGAADLHQIYEKLPKMFRLNEKQKALTQWGDRPMYEHEVRSCVSRMARLGALERLKRGRYAVPVSADAKGQ